MGQEQVDGKGLRIGYNSPESAAFTGKYPVNAAVFSSGVPLCAAVLVWSAGAVLPPWAGEAVRRSQHGGEQRKRQHGWRTPYVQLKMALERLAIVCTAPGFPLSRE